MSAPLNPPEFHPSHTEDDLWQLALGLDLSEGVRLANGRKGRPIIELDNHVPYPDRTRFDQHPAAQELLLEPVKGDKRAYRLPKNSTTLVNILNEAAGSTNSFEVSPSESRTVAVLSGLITNLGHDLERLALEEGIIPGQLSYKQVLAIKEDYRCKLLPPLTFEPIDSVHKAGRKIVETLQSSLAEGSTTTAQWHLTGILRRPINEAFEWIGENR